MIHSIVDTTVVVHVLRRNPDARLWVSTQPDRLAITSITWLEIMEGTTSKSNQGEAKRILSMFELLYLTSTDQQWAMQQLELLQFSHHIGMNDCLIAAVAKRFGAALYTHNLKDMTPLLGELAIKPY
ncbi:MAG: PIN domain-containing protein [Anaerolineae bacterium]